MPIYQLFFYLTIILLPTQLGLHLWPDWALVLGRRIDYLAPTLYLTDITILVMLLTYMFQKRNNNKIIQDYLRHKFLITSILLFILLNTYFSLNPLITGIKWFKVLEYTLLFFYIVKTKPSLKITVYCLTVAITYSSIIALAQFFLQHTIGGVFWFLGERTFANNTPGIAQVNWCWFSKTKCIELLRPYGTFPHPNVLGGFLATTLPLLLWQFTKEKQHIRRLIIVVSMTLGISALLVTFSRGAWIVGVMTLYVSLFIHPQKNTWPLKIGGSIAIVGILLFLFPYIQTLTKNSESVFIRINLMKAALALFMQHPTVGIGLGMFLPNLPSVLNVRDLYFLQPVHSIYLLLLTETGIIGVGSVIVTLFIYIRAIKKRHPLIVILLPSIALGLLGVTDHYPFSVQQGQLLTTCFLALPFLKTDS